MMVGVVSKPSSYGKISAEKIFSWVSRMATKNSDINDPFHCLIVKQDIIETSDCTIR